jgi:hypothetical protein
VAALEVTLEEPGDDFELNCTLIKIAGEITPDDLIKMKYLLQNTKRSKQ